MKQKTTIPAIDVDFSSVDGFVRSLMELAPYVAGYGAEELTAGRINRLALSHVRNSYYRSFEIPKKSGGTRTITAPRGELKRVQSVIAYALKDLYIFVPAPVHGFVEGRSIVTNAQEHTGKKYVYNIDLKDFFPSIRMPMVASALRRQGVDDAVARLIARICCYTPAEGGEACLPQGASTPKGASFPRGACLPQGASTSPILSNIVCERMDVRLSGLASSMGLTYTRYADDITFSSDRNVFYEKGTFVRKLNDIITESGFMLNPKKTRLQIPSERQEVTGVTVNEKPNVSRKYLKELRAEICNMRFRDVSIVECQRMMGKVNYVRMVRKAQGLDADYRSDCLYNDAMEIYWKIITRDINLALGID